MVYTVRFARPPFFNTQIHSLSIANTTKHFTFAQTKKGIRKKQTNKHYSYILIK